MATASNTLDLFISRTTSISRRKLLKLITDGKVKINGNVVTSLKHPFNPKTDHVLIEGKKVEAVSPKFLYYKVNKPKGYITTLSDPKDRKTIRDAFPKLPDHLVPVGRLDRQTTGLLLMSNDGAFVHKVSHPGFKVKKVYQVSLDKPLTKRDEQRLIKGLILEDGPILYDRVEVLEPKLCVVTLTSGRNRIVRRTFEHLGYGVKKLKRIAIGMITLGDLKEGEYKQLSPTELRSLSA